MLGGEGGSSWYCHHQPPGLSESLPVCPHSEKQHPGRRPTQDSDCKVNSLDWLAFLPEY